MITIFQTVDSLTHNGKKANCEIIFLDSDFSPFVYAGTREQGFSQGGKQDFKETARNTIDEIGEVGNHGSHKLSWNWMRISKQKQ